MTMGQSGGSVRRRPRRSEGRWQLRLAPGAASEDERGEDGSKTGNGGGLVGLTVGGGRGDGDSDSQKRTGDRGDPGV
jgi:hypothetical protein